MKYLKSFSVFEQESPKLDTSPGGSFNKALQDSGFFFSKTIENAPEGKFYPKPWEEFKKNLPNFEKKFPCLPKKHKSETVEIPPETRNYLYYAIFLILKNSPEIEKELKIYSDSDFNKLLRLSISILKYVRSFGKKLSTDKGEENAYMRILSGDSHILNSMKASAQQEILGKEASVGVNQMQIGAWNELKATHKIFKTNNIQSLGTPGKPNPVHFAVAMVASMEYMWNNYQKAKNIYGGKSVITANGEKCNYSLGSWAWDVAFCSYTFKFEDLTKKYCKCKFVDNIEKEGPFQDASIEAEPVIKTSQGETSVYWARDCDNSGRKPIWAEGNFEVIGTSNVKRLEVIPNSIIQGYIPRIYFASHETFHKSKGPKVTNRSILYNAYKDLESYSCLGI